MVLFNPYISSKTLTTNENFSIYTAMSEGLENIYKAFRLRLNDKPINPNIDSIYIPSNFSERALHVCVGLFLFLPGVGNVTQVVVRRFFTSKIPAPKMTLGKAKLVITKCIDNLNNREFNTKNFEGIFRIPGFENRLKFWDLFIQSKQDLNESDVEKLLINDGVSSYDIAKLMTRVLNSLSTPLLTTEEFNEFINADVKDEDLLRDLIKKLSTSKKDIFIQILSYLNKLLELESVTKMPLANLSMHWGTTLFHLEDPFNIPVMQKTYPLCAALIELAPQLSKDLSTLSKILEVPEDQFAESDLSITELSDDSPSSDSTKERRNSANPIELTEKISSLRGRSKSFDKKEFPLDSLPSDQRVTGSRKRSF